METKALIGVKDVAKEFGIHPIGINYLIRIGRLKATKFAGVWVIDPDSLEELRRYRAVKALKKAAQVKQEDL